MTNNIFSHSGDLGDIIYSLPTIKALGGGKLVLYNHPGKTAHGMTEAKVNRIRPLLEQQDYITSVEWSPIHVSYGNINGFRDHGNHGNLADMHLATHGLDWTHRQARWLTVDQPYSPYPVVIHRSQRYLNSGFPWQRIVNTYKDKIAFCGFPEEYLVFITEFGEVPFIRADNFLELARIIEGSKLFIGNMSSPCAVSQGLHHDMIMEISPGGHQHLCVFQRMNCIIGWDAKIELPEIS